MKLHTVNTNLYFFFNTKFKYKEIRTWVTQKGKDLIMKSKIAFVGIVYLFFHFLLIMNSAQAQKPTITISPLKDTFVRSTDPDDNFGNSSYVFILEDHIIPGSYYSFFYFELPASYEEYTHIYFHFIGYSMWVGAGLSVDFYNVLQSWDESTITWNNKPVLDELLFSTHITSGRVNNINMKSHITTYIFSFCIKASFAQDNDLSISSRENTFDESEELPSIILKDIITNNTPLIIGITVGSIVAAGICVGLGYFLYHRKKSLSRKNST